MGPPFHKNGSSHCSFKPHRDPVRLVIAIIPILQMTTLRQAEAHGHSQ